MASIPGLPPPPKSGGGHYVMVGGKPQLIKAVGPGKWAPASSIKAGKAGKANPNAGFNSALYNPSQTLSGKALDTAAGGIADAQVKGPISELAGQKQDFGYYMQLAQAAQDAVGQQQSIGTGLNSTLQGINAQQQAGIAQAGQQAQSGALGRMGAMGLDGGQLAALGATTAQQQGIGALNAQTFQSAGANQAANYTAAASANRGVVSLEGEQQIGDLARAGALANEPLNAKIGALQASRGALKATALGALRTQQRNYQIAEQGLQNTANAPGITVAQDVAKNKLTASGQAVTMRGQDLTAAGKAATNALTASGQQITSARDQANALYHNALRAQKQGKLGTAAKPMAPAQNSKFWGQVQKTLGLIQEAQGSIGKPNGAVAGTIRTTISAKFGFTDAVIETAYELLGYGSISASQAQILHGMGVRGGTYKGAPVKVTANYKPAAPTVGNAVKGALGTVGIG